MFRLVVPALFITIFLISNNLFAQGPGSLDLSFNPSDVGMISADGDVYAMAIQDDGKVIIGGRFTSYSGLDRNGIARLNVDGSVDPSFDPGAGFGAEHSYDIVVSTIVVQPDGKILVAGDFNSYDGISVYSIIRLNTDGTRDVDFISDFTFENTTFHPRLSAIAVQPDMKILIGGQFYEYQNNAVSGIVRLNPDGTLDNSFQTGSGVNGLVENIIVRNDNSVMISGYFDTYNGIDAKNIALLTSEGNLDDSFERPEEIDGRIKSTTIQPDGKIVVAGQFESYNSIDVHKIIRLNADGTIDQSFNAGNRFKDQSLHAAIHKIMNQTDGKIIVIGKFDKSEGRLTKNVERLNTDGTVDTDFNPGIGFNSVPSDLIIQPNNRILISGTFSSYNGVTRQHITRIQTDGSLDDTFNYKDKYHIDTGWPRYWPIRDIKCQPDGKIIAVGNFSSFFGISRNSIIRVNVNGSIDTDFNPPIEYNSLHKLLLQKDGKIIVAGGNKLLRLNADGSIDQTFDTGVGFDRGIYSMVLQDDGKIIVGGYFGSYNGTTVNKIVRLNTDGTIDINFSAGDGFDQEINCLELQSDGKIIAGGTFTSVDGYSRNRIVRLHTDGSVDENFQVGAGFDSRVFSLAIQPDGKIIAGGLFVNYDGTSINRIIRLNTDGSIDNSFISGTGFDAVVNSIVVQEGGTIVIGGNFSTYNGIAQGRITRLNEDGSLDSSFDTGDGFSGYVYSLAKSGDNNIIAGGYFYGFNSIPRSHIVRLIGSPNNTPEIPQNLMIESISDKQIILIWDNLTFATQYNIERSDNGIDFIETGTTVDNTFADDELMSATKYYYRVIAENGSGPSLPSEQIAATTDKSTQELTFETLGTKTYGDDDFKLSAFSSANLEPSYLNSDPSIIQIDNDLVKIVGTGTVKITAIQEGNSYFKGADPVEQLLTIEKSDQTITFKQIQSPDLNSSNPIVLEASSSSGLPVRFTSGDPSVISINENVAVIHKNGTADISALQDGNKNYNPATAVLQKVNINLITSISNNLPGSDKIIFYPNPTSKTLTIELNALNTNEKINISVIDNIGNQVFKMSTKNQKAAILNLEKLSSGVYFLKVTHGRNVRWSRFLKTNE